MSSMEDLLLSYINESNYMHNLYIIVLFETSKPHEY